MPTSARCAGAPVPSITEPPLMISSSMGPVPLRLGRLASDGSVLTAVFGPRFSDESSD
jgi:hypothetical protein